MAGKYYEDLVVGETFQHINKKKITKKDHSTFNALTMNTQPLHSDEEYASKTNFGQIIVNGIYTLGLAVGITVSDLTEGTIISNLSYENVKHPAPVFHGDTLHVETEVLSKRESKSNISVGIVKLKHSGRKQDGTIVLEVERTAMFLKRESEEN